MTETKHAEVRAQILLNNLMQEDVFSLSEGRVVIQWPAPLSAESIQDLKGWLKIVKRKITRSAKHASSESQSSGRIAELGGTND